MNVEVKEKVREKQNAFSAVSNITSNEEIEVKEAQCKDTKKLAKKAVIIAKNSTYERLYQKLNTKEGEKDVFKLARLGKRRQGTREM